MARRHFMVDRSKSTLDVEIALENFKRKIDRAEAYKAKKARPSMRTYCAECDAFKLCTDTGGGFYCAEHVPEKSVSR